MLERPELTERPKSPKMVRRPRPFWKTLLQGLLVGFVAGKVVELLGVKPTDPHYWWLLVGVCIVGHILFNLLNWGTITSPRFDEVEEDEAIE